MLWLRTRFTEIVVQVSPGWGCSYSSRKGPRLSSITPGTSHVENSFRSHHSTGPELIKLNQHS